MNVEEILLTVADETSDAASGGVRTSLAAHDWEQALNLLIDLGDGRRRQSWRLLATAAEQLYLERTRRWCEWRGYEAANGVIRAELTLGPSSVSGRTLPVPVDGVLRPMWHLDPADPDAKRHTARIWIEDGRELHPAHQGIVRLAPLVPEHWSRLAPGDAIAMYETSAQAGTATILEVTPPVELRGESDGDCR